jgi:hypothetical protein
MAARGEGSCRHPAPRPCCRAPGCCSTAWVHEVDMHPTSLAGMAVVLLVRQLRLPHAPPSATLLAAAGLGWGPGRQTGCHAAGRNGRGRWRGPTQRAD